MYEILSAYARFSDKIGIGRAGLQFYVTDEGAAVNGHPFVNVQIPPLFSTFLSSIVLISEEEIAKDTVGNIAHGDCLCDYPYPAR